MKNDNVNYELLQGFNVFNLNGIYNHDIKMKYKLGNSNKILECYINTAFTSQEKLNFFYLSKEITVSRVSIFILK